MKTQELKYLLLIEQLKANASATHAELSAAADMPRSLVNRYVRRLSRWGAVDVGDEKTSRYAVTQKGERFFRQGCWEFVASAAGLFNDCRDRAMEALRERVRQDGWRRAALYGATPLAETLRPWVEAAGLEVVGVCDEERSAERGVLSLDDVAGLGCDGIVLCDWHRADDGVLLRLLAAYGPVVNLFAVDGVSVPKWG